MELVSEDVRLKKGKILFGYRVTASQSVVVLPKFGTGEKTTKDIELILQTIGGKPRLRKNGSCEDILKNIFGSVFTKRCILAGKEFIPLDQEAATMLFHMKLPMLKMRHYVTA